MSSSSAFSSIQFAFNEMLALSCLISFMMDMVDISYSSVLNPLINHRVLLDFALVLSEIFHLKKCLPCFSCFLLYLNGLNSGAMDMVKVSYSCALIH